MFTSSEVVMDGEESFIITIIVTNMKNRRGVDKEKQL